jgi:hypothetical protein
MIYLWIYLVGLFVALCYAAEETWTDYKVCGWGGYTINGIKYNIVLSIVWPLTLLTMVIFEIYEILNEVW